MKTPRLAGGLPVRNIARRLPVGGRRKGIGKVVSALPRPGGKTAGTAGGLLLGAGAAVAAGRLVNRRHRDPHDAHPADEDTLRDEAEPETEEPRQDEGEQRKGVLGRTQGGKKLKVTNIVEHIDVGAPRRLVYDQFTQFQEFPSFMKKVVGVDQESDEKLNWKARIFWSSRTWEATIIEQVPDKRISWRSQGAKGHVDGTVSFHAVTPTLTRVLVNLEYHPQGLFERTGNLWRAQGRRARLELKHFRRHVMTHTLLLPEEDRRGWRGEIRDSEVVKTHEDALAEEEQDADDTYEEVR